MAGKKKGWLGSRGVVQEGGGGLQPAGSGTRLVKTANKNPKPAGLAFFIKNLEMNPKTTQNNAILQFSVLCVTKILVQPGWELLLEKVLAGCGFRKPPDGTSQELQKMAEGRFQDECRPKGFNTIGGGKLGETDTVLSML